MTNVFDIIEFGAVGDGKTDCTKAIQTALDEAGKVKGTVIVPPGRYLCADLKMHRDTSIRGFDAWSFRSSNSSVLVLSNENASCVLDITGAVGCTVSNLGLEGEQLGKNVHGISLNQPIYDASKEEDSPTIENCRVSNFSGNAVNFNHVWCATVRNNMLCFSENGFYHDGWDLFMNGNWLSGNRDSGFKTGALTSATIFTNNRVEWNMNHGMDLQHLKFTNICNNQFDRAGKAQIYVHSTGVDYNRNVVINGNSFNRSGTGEYKDWMITKDYESCHIYLENCVNFMVSSNVFQVGRDGLDSEGVRHFGPDYAIAFRHLRSSVIKDNCMQSGSVKQNIMDLGGHEEEVVVQNNMGTVMESEERWTAMLKDRPVEYIKSYFSLTDEEKKEMGLD